MLMNFLSFVLLRFYLLSFHIWKKILLDIATDILFYLENFDSRLQNNPLFLCCHWQSGFSCFVGWTTQSIDKFLFWPQDGNIVQSSILSYIWFKNNNNSKNSNTKKHKVLWKMKVSILLLYIILLSIITYFY